MNVRSAQWLTLALAAGVLGSCATAPPDTPSRAASPGARTVQPGSPGTPSRVISSEASLIPELAYTDADVRFMQGMIPHHAQALEMTALVPDRTDHQGFLRLALRTEISQRDEIAFMERWLHSNGEELHVAGGRGMSHMELMPGMLTQEQMAELQAASGVEFERLFLEYMIQHHEGAITMVAELFASPGAGQDSEVFRFASDVEADQRAEIERMGKMLVERR